MEKTNTIPVWYWFNKDKYDVGDNNGWVKVSDEDNMTIEEEYQNELKGSRSGQLVYHCFGNGYTACLSFNSMQTYCGSGRCMLGHHGKDLKDDHMVYNLKRILEIIVHKKRSGPIWYWFNKDKYAPGDKNGWVKVSDEDNISIESEYQTELKGTRFSQRVYHCFGNGFTAIVGFKPMQTYCGSGRCGCHLNLNGGLKEDHMSYDLKRIVE